MRALEMQLTFLQIQKAHGRDVDDRIADTLIAMLKGAYVRGEITLEHLEHTTMAILRGEPIAMLQPGEYVLKAKARELREQAG